MSKKNLDVAVYLTALLMAVAVFLPITSFPIVGEVTYHRIAEIEAYVIVALCLVTPILLLLEKPRLVVIPAVGVWLTLLFPAIQELIKSEDSFFTQASGQMSRQMQQYAADLFLNVTDFAWGGYVLLAALTGFTLSSVMRSIK